MLSVYVLATAGAVFHLFIQFWRRRIDETDTRIQTAGDVLLWIHVREFSLGMNILLLAVLPFGLALFFQDSVKSSGFAFLAGYCLDSVADVFLKRFDTEVQAFTAKISAAGGTS